MSLWYKQPENISYTDIDAFCRQQLPEGMRLDYKLDVPNDLEKVVAALANTLGGLIVLGVEADKTSNTPIWPSTKGMARKPGIEERITAICRDNIYPPVHPQISPVVDNPHAPGMVVAVLRVDQSPEAPHAVKGLVYERTGSQGTPYKLSEIDRIAHLLGRRNRIEEQRLELVLKELKRASRQLADIRITLAANAGLVSTSPSTKHPKGLPLRWASVIPVYPWQELCTPAKCYDYLMLFVRDTASFDWQKVPGGAFGVKSIPAGLNTASAKAMCCSLSTKGHVFAIECATEICFRADLYRHNRQNPPTTPSLSLDNTITFGSRLFDVASRFYTSPQVQLPGYVLLSIGLIDVYGCQMVSEPSPHNTITGKPFLDDDYDHDDLCMPVAQLINSPAKAATPLFDALRFGFDL